MRTRAVLVLAIALALALPALSSTQGGTTVRHRRAHFRHEVAHRTRHAAYAERSRYAHSRRTRYAEHAELHHSRERRGVEPVSYRRRRTVRRKPAETLAAPALAASIFAPIHFVPPLRGSRASLLRQNERDDAEGLRRIQDTAQLDELEEDGKLVPIPVSLALRVNPDLPMDRRYCRPWTARFLADLARSHYARFHRPLQVNSAVRTVAFQRALLHINGNAAPAEGDLASPHLTGAAIDIGKRDMSFSEISWLRAWLLPLQAAGKIDVEEEFYQACFHIDVYRAYVPGPLNEREASASSTLLATQVR